MADLWDGTLAAVLGAIFGAGGGLLATTYTNKANRSAARIEARLDAIEGSIEQLRLEAIAYWSSPSTNDEAASRRILAHWESIVTRVEGLEAFPSQVGDLSEVNNYVDIVYELVTGDDFQAKIRNADENKVHEIRKACNTLCRHVQSSRRLVNRWRYFWKRWGDSFRSQSERQAGSTNSSVTPPADG